MIDIGQLIGCLLCESPCNFQKLGKHDVSAVRGIVRMSCQRSDVAVTRAMSSEPRTTPRCWQSCNSVWMWSVQVEVHSDSLWCIHVHPMFDSFDIFGG